MCRVAGIPSLGGPPRRGRFAYVEVAKRPLRLPYLPEDTASNTLLQRLHGFNAAGANGQVVEEWL